MYGTGVLGGGGRIPLAKSEYGFDGRVTPRLYHKPHIGPKRPRIRKPFYLGPATLHGDNMRGLTARQIEGGSQKLGKSSFTAKTAIYHTAESAKHLQLMKDAIAKGERHLAAHHKEMADIHHDLASSISNVEPWHSFGKFDEWMHDPLEKAAKKKKNNDLRDLGIAAGAGAGLLAAGHYGGMVATIKTNHNAGMKNLIAADEYASGKRVPKYPYDKHNNIEMAPHKKAEFLRRKIEGHENAADDNFKNAIAARNKWNKTIPGRVVRVAKFGIKTVKNFVKSDELNSIARKSLRELAKDMGDSGLTSASTSVFNRAFGVPGNPNPQPVAHVNPGNHFASGWHWANGVPPAAPVATL